MKFVIDNSVVMAWLLTNQASPLTEKILDLLGLGEAHAFVPSIWPLEVSNMLLVMEKRQKISNSDSVRFIAILKALPISVEEQSPLETLAQTLAIGRRDDLSSYDSSYLDLAMRLGYPMATRDQSLAGAAKSAGVSLLSF